MKFIKKHRKAIIIISVILIILIILAIGFKNLLYPNLHKNIYGNRIEGIEKYDVNNSRLKSVANKLKENESIVKISNNSNGLIINHIITIKSEIGIAKAQELANEILTNFTEEEKSYFDFQVFILSEEADEDYPLVGYKHKTSQTFVW